MLTRVRRPSGRALVVMASGLAVHVAGTVLAVAVATALVGSSAGSSMCRAEPEILVLPGCPAVEVGAADDPAGSARLSMVVWQGRAYADIGGPPVPRTGLGRTVTTVGCSLDELEAVPGWRAVPGPWPDRTAYGLASGVPLLAVDAVPAECRLAAVVHGDVRVYTAVDLDDPALAPMC